jgi:hypothetical protein
MIGVASMAITTAQMAAKTASVTFEYQGESVTIVYNPDKINNAIIDQLDGNSESCNQAFATIIKSWDVYEDAEQTSMFPLDAERLKELSWPFRLAVRQTITSDMRPN